ncbi:MAG: TIGR02530 family flagellar biosynthesis protein [bacterium]
MERIQGFHGGTRIVDKDLKVKERLINDDFGKLLETVSRANGIRFSKHAIERLASRGLRLSEAHVERLNQAVDTARGKGANESLILMDELALVVSIKNRTVITAMLSGETKGNVFTSIDSTVIV